MFKKFHFDRGNSKFNPRWLVNLQFPCTGLTRSTLRWLINPFYEPILELNHFERLTITTNKYDFAIHLWSRDDYPVIPDNSEWKKQANGFAGGRRPKHISTWSWRRSLLQVTQSCARSSLPKEQAPLCSSSTSSSLPPSSWLPLHTLPRGVYIYVTMSN